MASDGSRSSYMSSCLLMSVSAWSRLCPHSNSAMTTLIPLEDVEVIFFTLATLDAASSRVTVTRFSISSGPAPDMELMMMIMGNWTFG